MSAWRLLHLVAAVVWVGGMFFAHRVLRPAALALDGPQRLGLWVRVFAGFFPWVGACILALLASGAALVLGLGGMRTAGAHVHAMVAVGLVMMAVFGHLNFASRRRLERAVAAARWEEAAAALGSMRRLVGLNLVLGAVELALGSIGRGLG